MSNIAGPANTILPPLTLPDARAGRARSIDMIPRLQRIACVLVALALLVFGIAVADTIHRADDARASRSAAPVDAPDGVAAHPDRRRGGMPR